MVYYLTNICNDKTIIQKRYSKFSQAGINRSEYIMSTINEDIEVVSLALPESKGYYKKEIIKNSNNTKYYYPSSLNIFKLKYLSIMLDIFFHLLNNVKDNDIIICYNSNIMYVLPLAICRKFKKVKVVYEIEELYSDTNITKGIRNRIMNISEGYMLKYSDSYIIVCENMKKKINNAKPNLINFGYEFNVLEEKANQCTEDNIIAYNGRLDYEGGIEIFLDSLNYIKNKVKVIITGSGPLKDKVENFRTSNNNIDIKYLGFVHEVMLNEILKSAKVCVNPLRLSSSYSAFSFPSKVIMYLSYGCNVVSSDSNGILPLKELNNLFVYNDDSSKLLAEKIEEALLTKTDKIDNIKRIDLFFEKQRKELNEFWTLVCK